MESMFIVTVLVLLIFIWLRRQGEKMRYFKRIGIPGPPPHFIKGNIQEIEEKGLGECHKQWVQKYGRIVGYYIGCRPFVLVADPELLKLIEIKNFSDFSDRRVIVPGGTLPVPTASNSVIFNKGRKWVEIRSVLSPAFTSGKLRKMYALISGCLEEFLQVLRTSLKSSETVDIRDAFRHFSLDVIGRTSFGIKTDVQHNQSSPFISDCEMALSYSFTNSSLRMNVYFPEISPVVTMFRSVCDYLRYLLRLPSTTGVFKACSEVIAARRTNKEVQKCDLLQLMIDSRVSEEDIGSNEEDVISDQSDANRTINSAKGTVWHSMTDKEIQANAVLFLLAGHHTTSTCLTYTAYLLSIHQEIQDKLREEVKTIINDGEVSYDDVMTLPYMDQVVSESLRLYPPVTRKVKEGSLPNRAVWGKLLRGFITRESTAELRYKDLVLPKGTAIQAAIAALHHDPEYWNEPQRFDPERFSPENKKNIGLYYQPFGAGRRNCVGMRLAFLEIKLALARLIHNFRILPGSTEELKIDQKVSFTTPRALRVQLTPISS